jgi:hypothetical protein
MCHHREAAAEWEALARKAYENREEERAESDVERADAEEEPPTPTADD